MLVVKAFETWKNALEFPENGYRHARTAMPQGPDCCGACALDGRHEDMFPFRYKPEAEAWNACPNPTLSPNYMLYDS